MSNNEHFFYVKRDKHGKVEGLFAHEHDDASEVLPHDHPDIIEFMSPDLAQELLAKSDLSMIRVIEDILELLLMKEVISITDLPDAVLGKLNMRRVIREKLHDYTINDEPE